LRRRDFFRVVAGAAVATPVCWDGTPRIGTGVYEGRTFYYDRCDVRNYWWAK
jgi:hypothetical protein